MFVNEVKVIFTNRPSKQTRYSKKNTWNFGCNLTFQGSRENGVTGIKKFP